jgi:hypothetical protein
MNTTLSPTLPMSSISCACSCEFRVFCLSRSASSPVLLSLMCISSSSIFGMRPTPNAQSTDALRTHARRSKFASCPAGFGLLPPDELWAPSKKLATSPWESVCVRHPPGKCEPHTRKNLKTRS